jgi:hypothetical protein
MMRNRRFLAGTRGAHRQVRREVFRRIQRPGTHPSAELIRAVQARGIFPHPAQLLTICVGKSTYARCGIIVNVTPFEPEWEGFVTLEISNPTPLPAKMHANEGLAQAVFSNSTSSAKSPTRTKSENTIRSGASLFPNFDVPNISPAKTTAFSS